MDAQMDGGKFGFEIPALTEARMIAEASSYSAKSRSHYEAVMEKSAPLIERVNAFLEKNGAAHVAGCGQSLFGIITSDEDPKAPCGITFFGSGELAQSLANAFPGNKVMSTHDGSIVAPAGATMPPQPKPRQAPRPRF